MATRWNILPALVGMTALTIFVALYLLSPGWYFAVIRWWGFGAYRYPFLDFQYVVSQVRCWQIGVDVYLHNPCDPLGRLHDYSPLWLRLPLLGSAEPYLNVGGLLLDGAFMLSLLALPKPRRRIDTIPVLLGVVSPATAYALERGNFDVMMFLLAVVAIVSMAYRRSARLLGYAAIMIGGLLKFYPFVLLILLLRERLWAFVLMALTATGIIGTFVWRNVDEIRHMLVNIPQPSVFQDAFGATRLPLGIAYLMPSLLRRLGSGEASPDRFDLTFALLMMFLVIVCGLTAWQVAKRGDIRRALQGLTQREALSLFAGGMLVCGCFLSGHSIEYRAVLVLLTLPGLAALARTAPGHGSAWTFRIATWMAVFLMVSLTPRVLIAYWFGPLSVEATSIPALIFWLIRELCWWSFVTFMLGILVQLVLDFALVAALTEFLANASATIQKNRSNHASSSAGDSSAI